MKKYLEFLALFWRLGAINEMEYRANFFLHAFETVLSLITGLSVLWVVYSQTSVIGGWTLDEILVVYGLWFIVGGVVNMVIAPSFRGFIHDIWLGNLDFLLVKPANHQFLASTRLFAVFQLVDVVIGSVVLTVAIVRLEGKIGWEQALMFVVALAVGAVILYSFWVALATLAIWTVKLENIMLVFFAMFEAGRWPAGLYPYWLRYSLTFIVPISFAITVPAEAILGDLSWAYVGMGLAWAVFTFSLSSFFFRYGVRYKYMGASA